MKAYTRPCCVVAFSHCARTGAARSKRGFYSGLSALAGLQGGYLNSNKPKDSIRIDLRPQTWQLTSIVVCCGLASFVACVLLVVAISAVSWLSWRSGVLQRSVVWLYE